MNQDDLNLIRAAKKGRAEAIVDLIRNYNNFVFRTAFGVLQNRLDAEDVAQEVFIKVHRSLKSLRDERTFPTWIARITVRTALDFLNHNNKHKLTTLDPDRLQTAESSHEASELRLDIEQALGQLNHEQRTILILREFQGFDYEELAQILDIPVGTVRSRLHHARTQIRLILSGERGQAR